MGKKTTAIVGLSYEVSRSQKGLRTIAIVGPPPTTQTFNDDTDYTSPGLSFSVTHHFSFKETLRFKVGFKTRRYTADLTDRLHGERDDRTHNLLLTNSFKLTPHWTWKVGYELFKRDSNRSYANYTENSLTTGIDYLFK